MKFDRHSVPYVVASLFASVVWFFSLHIVARLHRNDLVNVYTRVGGIVLATNVMTFSAYRSFQDASWKNENTLTVWGNPMFIPTNGVNWR